MAGIFLNSKEQGIVVFMIWKNLDYKLRLLISISVILCGFAFQYLTLGMLPGLPMVLAGNLLLLPRGFTNKVELGKYDAASNWEKVPLGKLEEIKEMDRKIRKWNRSAIDTSNPLGCFFSLIISAVVAVALALSIKSGNDFAGAVGLNLAALLLPFWLTGKRSKFMLPNILMKVDMIFQLLAVAKEQLAQHKLEYFLLLQGKAQVPGDAKFKVDLANHKEGFLGFYGQVSINVVGNIPYPYFYVVLVARKGFGLQGIFNRHIPGAGMIKEFNEQEDVEVLIIRQKAEGGTGYHTSKKEVKAIFLDGLQLAEKYVINLH